MRVGRQFGGGEYGSVDQDFWPKPEKFIWQTWWAARLIKINQKSPKSLPSRGWREDGWRP
jgi:hypothetical protein